MTRAVAIALVLAATTAPALADPDLRVRHAPPPHHLKMRVAAAPVPVASMPPPTGPSPAPPPRAALATDLEPIGGIGGLRDPNQPVTFQIDTGYAIDGTEASTHSTTLANQPATPDVTYARIRTYGFGEAYLGTHGVGYAPLQTFLSTRVEVTRPFAPQSAGSDVPLAPPIAIWFDHNNVLIRSAWAEVHGVSERPWLSPLRVRGGELYVYGPWVIHIRGALAAWEGKTVTVTGYAGQRAPDYADGPLTFHQALIKGASAKIDLRGFSSLPVLFTGEVMTFGALDGSPETRHATADVDWRPRRDMVVRAETRWLDNAFANERLQVRSRYKQVTNIVLDVIVRSRADWQWDPSVTQQDAVGEARRYLDLGPIVPQVVASARAGTVLFDNLDLLARVAFAGEIDKATDQLANPALLTAFSAPYFEVAGAADVRIRRQVTLGASVLSRQNTERPEDLPAPLPDVVGQPDALANLRNIGQQGFVEIGVSARMSLGARRFSAMVEAYGRRTRYADSYCVVADSTTKTCAATPVPAAQFADDIHGGGRFTVDAWVNKHLRLFAAYDVSSQLAKAPEITGYKSLRLVVEGVY